MEATTSGRQSCFEMASCFGWDTATRCRDPVSLAASDTKSTGEAALAVRGTCVLSNTRWRRPSYKAAAGHPGGARCV